MASARLEDHRQPVDLCVFCPKLCRFACPVAEAESRETVTPWGLMIRIDDARSGRRPLDAEAGELWAHCTGCGRCTAVCKHEVPVFEVVRGLRGRAAEAGHRPPAVQAWADTPAPESPAWQALPTGGPVQIVAGHADDAAIADAVLVLRATGWTLGRGPRVTPRRHHELGDSVALGRPMADTVIALEAADAQWLRHTWPDLVVLTLPEAVAGRLPAGLAPVLDGDALYLDSCRLGRGLGVYAPPRALLAALIGGAVLEAVMHHDEGGCCGAGAGYAAADPEGAALAAQALALDAPLAPIVIADPVCAAHLAAHAGRPVHRLSALLAQALQGAHS